MLACMSQHNLPRWLSVYDVYLSIYLSGYSSSRRWTKPSSWNFHSLLSLAVLVQAAVPMYDVRSSLHLLFCLPLLLFPTLGCHSVKRFVHLLSCSLATCPAHLHFDSLTFSMMSLTFVFWRMTLWLILSRRDKCDIFLSIALWVVTSFCSRSFVNDHVSDPYVIVVRMHWLNILLLSDMGMFLSVNMSLYLPKFIHPAFTLIITSSFVVSSIFKVCPRYL